MHIWIFKSNISKLNILNHIVSCVYCPFCSFLCFIDLDSPTEEETEIRKAKGDSTGYTPIIADECLRLRSPSLNVTEVIHRLCTYKSRWVTENEKTRVSMLLGWFHQLYIQKSRRDIVVQCNCDCISDNIDLCIYVKIVDLKEQIQWLCNS